MLSVYVIANGDMFREAFNAMVTLVGTDTFETAMRISAIMAILAAALHYIQGKDLMSLAKWFGLYFFVLAVLLGPKESIQIIDVTDPGRADLTVDHVPYGIAVPAWLVTNVGHALAQTFDDVFHMPDDIAYTKTGMLFGSNLFRLSTGFTITDPDLRSQMTNYIKSCTIGDILINHKYTIKDVMNSSNIWALITKDPSPLRGLYIDRVFYTCQDATPMLQQSLLKEASKTAPSYYASRIIGDDNPALKAEFTQLLSTSYEYFTGLSGTATDIIQQNLMIAAFRSGVTSYIASTGNTAAMEDYASTAAMEKMRMSWATSRHIATETLPLMQTTLLMLMFCLFPLIILLAIQPVFGYMVMKNYIVTLIWLESWPMMFAILNFASTFYIQSHTSSLAASGVTLSNANPLALEHSDIAGMAGYLTLSIPFISYGIVKGMAMAFNQAAQYIGGMAHSVAQGSSTEAVMGNFSMGQTNWRNTSANNLNANKHDTNYTDFSGQQTQQLGNAATMTHTASGETVYNTSGAMSNLATSINGSQQLTEAYQRVHEESLASSQHHRQQFDIAASSAYSDMVAYDHQTSNNQSVGHTEQSSQSTAYNEAISRHVGMVDSLAKKEGINTKDAWDKLSQASLNESAGFDSKNSFGGKILSGAVGVSGKAEVAFQQRAQSSQTRSHDQSTDHNISTDDMKQWREDTNLIANHSKSDSFNSGSHESNALANKTSADFREMQTSSTNYSADLSRAQRASEQATYSENHSQSINQNFTQMVADKVSEMHPSSATSILANTSDPHNMQIIQQTAQDMVQSQVAQSLHSSDSHLKNFNPKADHDSNGAAMNSLKMKLGETDLHNRDKISNAALSNTAFDNAGERKIQSQVNQSMQQSTHAIHNKASQLKQRAYQHRDSGEQSMTVGKKDAQTGLIMHPAGWVANKINQVVQEVKETPLHKASQEFIYQTQKNLPSEEGKKDVS